MQLVSFPALLYKLSMQLLVIMQSGYVSIFTGALTDLKYPFWTTGSGTLFYLGFLLVILSYPKRRVFLWSAFLFFVYLFADALKGGRGRLIALTIGLVYVYQAFYKASFSWEKIIAAALCFLFFSLFMGQVRNTFSSSAVSAQSKSIIDFFEGQATSIGSPLMAIERKKEQEEFRKYPYIFSLLFEPYYNAVSPETRDRPSVERLYLRNENESIISAAYSLNMYLSGYGIGSTFFTEMYDFYGIIGMICWSFILGLLLIGVERFMLQSRFCLLMSWFVISSLAMLPRDHFFTFIKSAGPYVPLITLAILLINLAALPKKIDFFRQHKNS